LAGMVWLNLQVLAGRYSRQFSLPSVAAFHSFSAKARQGEGGTN